MVNTDHLTVSTNNLEQKIRPDMTRFCVYLWVKEPDEVGSFRIVLYKADHTTASLVPPLSVGGFC